MVREVLLPDVRVRPTVTDVPTFVPVASLRQLPVITPGAADFENGRTTSRRPFQVESSFQDQAVLSYLT